MESLQAVRQHALPHSNPSFRCPSLTTSPPFAGIVRYADGALGMLFVEERFRGLGLAKVLVAEGSRALDDAGLPCFAFIVEGNAASEAVFLKLGWQRVADADWVSFVPCSDAHADRSSTTR
jgi:GNAT superfamily N-acetyltransferase